MKGFSIILGSKLLGLLFVFCWNAASGSSGPIDTIRLRNFTIKAYISLLNRKPEKTEIQAAVTRYKLYTQPERGKLELVRSLVKSQEFGKGLFDLFRYEFLQGTDPDEIETQIADYRLLLSIKTQEDFADIFQKELDRFVSLKNATSDYNNGIISYNEFQKRFFDNKFYDDINMGDNNFVTSTFNYLFYRNPTKYELEEGRKMYNGQFGILFSHSGFSKSDYLKLLFESSSWKEGNIRFWFGKLINRNPTHQELYQMMNSQKEFSLSALIEYITQKPEFAGK
jgi:hypothetical protein